MKNAISDFKENRLHYEIQSQSHKFSTFVSEVTSYNYKHGKILPLHSLIDAYAAELRMIGYMKYAGLGLVTLEEEEQNNININYDNYITSINKLQDGNNYEEIEKMLIKERINFYEMSKNDQFAIDGKIKEENKAIDKIHLWTLIFYAIGIVVLTMDKVKDAISGNKEDNELKTLLKKIHAQNEQLLRKKK